MPEIFLYRAPMIFRKQVNAWALLMSRNWAQPFFTGALYALH